MLPQVIRNYYSPEAVSDAKRRARALLDSLGVDVPFVVKTKRLLDTPIKVVQVKPDPAWEVALTLTDSLHRQRKHVDSLLIYFTLYLPDLYLIESHVKFERKSIDITPLALTLLDDETPLLNDNLAFLAMVIELERRLIGGFS